MIKTDTGIVVPMRHLRPVKSVDGYELPVSAECIFNDTRSGIRMLFDDLIKERRRAPLPDPQRMALTFITEGVVERGDID